MYPFELASEFPCGDMTAALVPWQIELFRRSDFLNVPGGYPDDEFCGWNRRVESKPSVPCRAP